LFEWRSRETVSCYWTWTASQFPSVRNCQLESN
jgi:hypothetical protein